LALLAAVMAAAGGPLPAQTVSVDALKGGMLGNDEIAAEWQLHDGRLSGVAIHARKP